jgi:hypothetical protein
MQLRNEICPEKRRCRSVVWAVTNFRKAIGKVIKENFKLKEAQRERVCRNKVHCLNTRHLFATKILHVIRRLPIPTLNANS